ncbi:MAG: NUDIX hydrolase [Myxococcota bacterium]
MSEPTIPPASAVDHVWRAGMRVAYQLQLLWWRFRKPRIEGSYVAVWCAGELLVIQNSYRPSLSLPAGGLKRGESPREAAVRELGEEVGIHVAAEALDYHGKILDAGAYAQDHAHFFELACSEPPGVRVDGREVVWARFLPIPEARERLSRIVLRYLEEREAGRAESPEPD